MPESEDVSYEDLQDAIFVIKNLDNIPATKRSVDQQKLWDAALELLRNNGLEAFKELTKRYFAQLEFHFSVRHNKVNFEDTVNQFEHDFEDIKVPEVPQNLNETAIKEFLLQLAAHQDRLLSILQTLIPIQGTYDQIGNHAENICKAVASTKHDWEASSLFAILAPPDFIENQTRLNALVSACRQKANRFSELFKVVSRVITVEIGTPGSDSAPAFGKPDWAVRK